MHYMQFTSNDQQLFSKLSGDFNPLHMDPLVARRSQFGRPIVHGIHLSLWSLEQFFAQGVAGRNSTSLSEAISKLTCVFRSPVGVDEPVEWKIVRNDGSQIHLSVMSNETECVAVRVQFSPGHFVFPYVNSPLPEEGCLQRAAHDFNGLKGTTPCQLDQDLLKRMFPNLAEKFPVGQLALFLATTRVVGMQCPGYYSLFSSLDLELSPDVGISSAGPSTLSWEVRTYDERFSRLTLGLSAANTRGSLTAFYRLRPQEQPSMSEIAKIVRNDEYLGRNALVIGGSRGLGELCAKMLAAGGADIRLTYHRGFADAQRVVSEIEAEGKRAASLSFDVLSPGENDLQARLGREWRPSHVYYFATPPILASKRFSMDLFNGFCRYYVDGFYQCWTALRGLSQEKITLFYPSSVYVEEIPGNMGEYAAAKAAGENLCRLLAKTDKKLEVRMIRLPRLPSDQTLSLMEEDTANPFHVMQDVLR